VASRNRVAERLLTLLADGELGGGDRLPPERDLAEQLGIARSSLREGLRRLVDLGIVEARQGSGTYVTPVDLADLLAVRLQLEPYAARLAAARRGEDDLGWLDEALDELRAGESDATRFAAADARLHALVTDASGSVALRIVLTALADLLRYSRATTSTDAGVRAGALVQHERIVTAIRAGDGLAAERAMRAHLRDVGRALARA
jgi:GntR family transcriptional repressor for pyruvate dehydrogenase complex